VNASGKNYEILAPAGNKDALVAAVNNGADAVYLGLDRFNARMKAENFSLSNLRQWADYCHLYGVKLYVTLNTSIKQNEYQDAVDLLFGIYNNYADGVILTDLSLIALAAQSFHNFEIIASTQLNIHDLYGARFIEKLGATKVVLARETRYSDIEDIVKYTNLTVECFIHGAMCVCQSGQCLFSSMVGGNSGNRGLCSQPCRKFYRCVDAGGKTVNSGYLLSMKDMCGLTVANKLYELGVKSYKIEGRNRRSQYAGVTSDVYSRLFRGNFVQNSDMLSQLKRIYNRGDFLSDEYQRGLTDNIIYPKTQSHIGLPVGVVEGKKLRLTERVEKGDGFKILRDGFEVGSAEATESGNYVAARISGSVHDGDVVALTTDINQLQATDSVVKKLPISVSVYAKAGERLSATANYIDISVTVESDHICQLAQKISTSNTEIEEQLYKTGNSCYTITDIVLYTDDVFLPKSIINALRRDLLSKLSEEIVQTYNSRLNREYLVPVTIAAVEKQPTSGSLSVIVTTEQQLQQALCDNRIANIIVKLSDFSQDRVNSVADTSKRRVVYIDIPSFANLSYVHQLISSTNLGIVCHNIGAVELAKTHKIPYIAGSGLNIFNSHIAAVLTDKLYIVSTELTISEAAAFATDSQLQFVFGKMALMKLSHCPYKLNFAGSCDKCNFTPFTYVDELGNTFEMTRTKCPHCTFELYNGVILNGASRINKRGNYLIDYNDMAVDHLTKINSGENSDFSCNLPYTKGRLFDKIN
jgi:putative protease